MNRNFYPDRQKLEEQYAKLLPLYIDVLELFLTRLKEKLVKTNVHFTVKYRVKTFASYYSKLLKRKSEEKKTGESIPIHDILGTRVACPFLEDVEIIEQHLREVFSVYEIEHKGASRTFSEFGYSSTHVLLEIPEDIRERYPALDLKIIEVQIRTFLQDAWAEVEHELVYKNSNSITPMDEPLRRKLAALNANLSLSDDIFQEIRDYQRRLHCELNRRRRAFVAQLDEIKPGLVAPARPADAAGQHDTHETRAMLIINGNGDNSVVSVNGGDNDGETPEINSSNKDQLLLCALGAHNEKNYPLAVSIYTKILEQEAPADIKALVLIHRGKAYFSQSNYRAALKDFEEAAVCEPGNNRAHYHLGIVNRVLDDNSAAQKALQRCVEIDPFHVDALFALGRVYFDMGDFPGALEYCEKVLLVEPNSVSAKDFRKMVMSRLKM